MKSSAPMWPHKRKLYKKTKNKKVLQLIGQSVSIFLHRKESKISGKEQSTGYPKKSPYIRANVWRPNVEDLLAKCLPVLSFFILSLYYIYFSDRL